MITYKDYSSYLRELFGGQKMQKLTVNAKFTCPNRDGSIGRGGCIYCNNASFSPAFADGDTDIEIQLEKAKMFFARKYPDMRYIAYFQSYTNTYGRDVESLVNLYNRALAVDGVDGIIIGTRPDCIPDGLLERLATINRSGKRVMMEYGAETSHDTTLRKINRGHTWHAVVDAVNATVEAGLECGLHFILGLPGETEEMMLQTVDSLSRLPINSVKFHQLQVIEGTPLAKQYRAGESDATIFTVEDYLDLCVKIVHRIRRDIAIERFTSQSPANLLLAPRWGLKNYEFVAKLQKLLLNSK